MAKCAAGEEAVNDVIAAVYRARIAKQRVEAALSEVVPSAVDLIRRLNRGYVVYRDLLDDVMMGRTSEACAIAKLGDAALNRLRRGLGVASLSADFVQVHRLQIDRYLAGLAEWDSPSLQTTMAAGSCGAASLQQCWEEYECARARFWQWVARFGLDLDFMSHLAEEAQAIARREWGAVLADVAERGAWRHHEAFLDGVISLEALEGRLERYEAVQKLLSPHCSVRLPLAAAANALRCYVDSGAGEDVLAAVIERANALCAHTAGDDKLPDAKTAAVWTSEFRDSGFGDAPKGTVSQTRLVYITAFRIVAPHGEDTQNEVHVELFKRPLNVRRRLELMSSADQNELSSSAECSYARCAECSDLSRQACSHNFGAAIGSRKRERQESGPWDKCAGRCLSSTCCCT